MTALTLPLLAVLAASTAEPTPRWVRDLVLEYETGPGYVFQNEHQYGATGTRFDEQDTGEDRNLFLARRIAAEAGFGERHAVILLYAPLDLTTRATLTRNIDFRGTVFREGEVVDNRYLFDGYRGSYLFALLRSDRFKWEIGASIQIRNAAVEMSTVDTSPARYAVEHDIGTVFALKTRLWFAPRPQLWAALEADGISSFGVFEDFSGALYDVSLSAGTPVRRGIDVFLRLRWLGGGARVESRHLDNWANLFFATAGFRADFVNL